MATFNFRGQIYPLITGKNNSYVCPNCKAERSSISGLRRHMDRNCERNQDNNEIQENEDIAVQTGAGSTSTITGTSIGDGSTLEGMGLIFNPEWNVLICKRCRHIVDQSMILDHLTKTHKLNLEDDGLVWRTLRSYKVRPHLLVMWDESVERELDDSDDDQALHGAA
ncbi:hypothetical protein V1504DRAFT_465585, partial [Lipomyces starkeyi]